MIFILLVKFSISIFIFNLFMCISPINNDKINSINLIDPHTSVWWIELDIIEGLIEHPIYNSEVVWSIEL
jgi:hypothetical protein